MEPPPGPAGPESGGQDAGLATKWQELGKEASTEAGASVDSDLVAQLSSKYWQYCDLSKQLARCPGCCVVSGLSIVTFISVLGLALIPPDIETNFDSFLKTDVPSSLMHGAFEAAQESRSSYTRRLQGREVRAQRGLQEASSTAGTSYMSKELFLAYEPIDPRVSNDGILSGKIISSILKFEQRLRDLPEWQDLCGRADAEHRDLCDPGVSFANYIMPTIELHEGSVVPARLSMDGQGFDMVTPKIALMLAETHRLDKLFLPSNLKSGPLTASALRSAFRFKVPCCSTEDSLASRRAASKEFKQEWHRFSTEVVMPILKRGAGGGSIRVWYQGSDFMEFEVKEALAGDMGFAVGSMVFVWAYLLFHTRSLLLSILGPVIALFSVPLTYVVCALLFRATTVSFANFLSLFLIVGFGADVIFVYTDYWRESGRQKVGSDAERLAWTFHRASRASFATTATTGLSFLANLASVIRALRQFGFFMGVSVLLTWVLISLIYAPLCVVDERLCGWCPFYRPTLKARLFSAWVAHLRRWRRTWCASTLLCFVLFIGLAVPNVEAGEGLPSIFPKSHNQNRGAEVLEMFVPAGDSFGAKFAMPPRQVQVCRGDNFTGGDWCDLYWCEAIPLMPRLLASAGRSAPRLLASAESPSCDCVRQMLSSCQDEHFVKVAVRFVGLDILTAQGIDSLAAHLEATGDHVSFANGKDAFAASSRSSRSLIIQEWESGYTELTHMREGELWMSRNTSMASSCGWQEVCFCGGNLTCKFAGWQPTQPLRLAPSNDTARRRLASPALPPAALQIPKSRRTKVRVIFGLEVATGVSLLAESSPEESWTFLPTFDFRQPWTQRNLYSFCTKLPKEELLVTASWCWAVDFKQHLTSKSLRFPVRAIYFNEAALDYITHGRLATRGTRYVWVMGSQVKGVYFSFEAAVDRLSSPSAEAIEYKAKWDEQLDLFNSQAMKSAQGAFHVSKLWVRTESTGHLISSTAQTMVILLVLAFGGMLSITRSCMLSLFVVAGTLFVLGVLVFFITAVMGWPVGLIEVIAVVYFIGYALDYSLHIAHKYASNEPLADGLLEDRVRDSSIVRYWRTQFAVQSIGGAALGSAITTAGASLFLTFCTLTVFQKLGGMCLIVTVASIVTALGPVPAALLTFGPVWPGCCRRPWSKSRSTGSEGVLSGSEPRARE